MLLRIGRPVDCGLSISGLVEAVAYSGWSTTLQDDSLLLHGAEIFLHLFVLLLELIVLLSQALDLTLGFLRFQLRVCLVLIVLSTQLVNFFTLFLRVIGNHLEVLLALLKRPLFLA